MRVGEGKEGAGRRKQGRGASAPPPPASFPSPITVQEQQKSGESREVQIAEGSYSVLSGGWHGGSQGAYCWEGRKTRVRKTLGRLGPLGQLAFAVQCGNQRPVCRAMDPRILWACAVVCSPEPRTLHVRKFEARGRTCRVIFEPGLHLITVSLAACA